RHRQRSRHALPILGAGPPATGSHCLDSHRRKIMAMTNDDHFALLEAIRSVNANWMPGDTAKTELAPEERRRRVGYAPGPGEPTLEDREAQARTRQLSAGALAPQP